MEPALVEELCKIIKQTLAGNIPEPTTTESKIPNVMDSKKRKFEQMTNAPSKVINLRDKARKLNEHITLE